MNMHYSGLGIARDLAGSGVRVIGLSFDNSFFGNRSRYCEFRLYPNSQFAPSQCLNYLVDLSKEIGGKPLLLPTRDIDILFVMQFRQTIDDHYTLAYPDNQVLENIVNKEEDIPTLTLAVTISEIFSNGQAR